MRQFPFTLEHIQHCTAELDLTGLADSLFLHAGVNEPVTLYITGRLPLYSTNALFLWVAETLFEVDGLPIVTVCNRADDDNESGAWFQVCSWVHTSNPEFERKLSHALNERAKQMYYDSGGKEPWHHR